MKTTFKAGKKEETVETAAETTTAVATTQPQPPAVITSGLQGDFNQSDINIPKLQIVQAVGPAKVAFPDKEGYWVLAKETLLTKGADPIRLVVLGLQKSFVENLPYSEDNIGNAQLFKSESEVIQNGGTLFYSKDDHGKDVPPTFIPFARVTVLVEAPKGLEHENLFLYNFKDKAYALALWELRKTSYTSVAKTLIGALGHTIKGKETSGMWEATSKYEKRGEHYTHVPYVRLLPERNSAEFVEFVNELLKTN